MAGGSKHTYAMTDIEYQIEQENKKRIEEQERQQKEKERQEKLAATEVLTSKIKSWTGVNWQARLPNTAKITEILIPGTHDSLTKGIKDNSLTAVGDAIAGVFSFGIGGLHPFSTCQNLTISEQLNVGVRFFDIRTDPNFHGRHNNVHTKEPFCTFDDNKMPNGGAFKTVIDFLKNNPTEFVFMRIKLDHDGQQLNSGPKLWEKPFHIKLSNMLYHYSPGNLWVRDTHPPEVFEVRGKIIIFDEMGGSTWRPSGAVPTRKPLGYPWETNGQYIVIQDNFKNPSTSKKAQDFTKLFTDNANVQDRFIVNFLSASGTSTPKEYANSMNPWFLKEYVDIRRTRKGIVVFDFAYDDLIKKAWGINF